MRAVVCAYGEVGHACLRALLDQGAEVALVVTHDDAPGEKIWFPSVRELARSAGIETIAPRDVNSPEVISVLRAARPEFLFSFYFRQMMRSELLALPTRGALNLHGSLLPRYRGRAPVNWVLLHGEKETGVTLHYMDEKPDHGDIVAQRRVAIDRDDTALTLTRKLAREGARLLAETYASLEVGTAPRRPQDHSQASYFGRRRPEDGRIDWRRPAEEIRDLIRAVTDPWPGAFTSFGGRRLWVWAGETRLAWGPGRPGSIHLGAGGAPLVATGQGALELQDVTWDGDVRRSGVDWAREAGLGEGARFEEPCMGAAGGER